MAILFVAVLFASNAEAYYDDMHYDYTYYLARSVGFTPEQAYRIASANLSIDYDPDTEPVQLTNQLSMWAASAQSTQTDPTGILWSRNRKKFVAPASIPRIKFHAMMDCLNWERCHFDSQHKANALAVIPENNKKLWKLALETNNLGAFLHFLEDEPSHEGYPSDNGHWSAVDMWWNNKILIMGSATDYIDFMGNDGKRDTKQLIDEIISKMTQFMKLKIPKQKLRIPKPDSEQYFINDVYQELRKVNRVKNAPGFQEALASAIKKNALGIIPSLLDQRAALATVAKTGFDVYSIWKTESEPHRLPAYNVVKNALSEKLKSLETTYPYEHIQYDLDKDGKPVGQKSIDSWVLSGNLQLNFNLIKNNKSYSRSTELMVKIKSVPTFKNEKPYLIDTVKWRGITQVDNLPVGDVRLEIYHFGVLLKETVIKIEKQEQYLELWVNLDKGDLSLELDEHLERMRTLISELKDYQIKFQVTNSSIVSLLKYLKTKVAELNDYTSLDPNKIRRFKRLSNDQNTWVKKSKKAERILGKTKLKIESNNSLVCSKNYKGKNFKKLKAETLKQIKFIARFDEYFKTEKAVLNEYLTLNDLRKKYKQLSPKRFENSLDDLYDKIVESLDEMADIQNNIRGTKSEIKDIKLLANKLIDKELKNSQGKNGSVSQTMRDYYNSQRKPFSVLSKKALEIKVDLTSQSARRKEFKAIITGSGDISDMLLKYKNTYKSLRVKEYKPNSTARMRKSFDNALKLYSQSKVFLKKNISCLKKSGNDEPSAGYLIVKVEGSGYLKQYADEAVFTKGSHLRWIMVTKGKKPKEVVKKYYQYIGNTNDCTFGYGDRTIMPKAKPAQPTLWLTGPKVTILKRGPYKYDDPAVGKKLKNNWTLSNGKGSYIEVRKKLCGVTE